MQCTSCGNKSDFTIKKLGPCCDYCGSIMPATEMDIVARSEIDKSVLEVDLAVSALTKVLPVVGRMGRSLPDSIHLAPEIPSKKLNNFLAACKTNGTFDWLIKCLQERDAIEINGILPTLAGIFGLVDCTIWGGGKESLVFAWGGLAYKALGEEPAYVTWETIVATVGAGQPVSSVGIINPVFQVGGTQIDIGGSDVSDEMLEELIATLNNLEH